jgi:hypothetical protein
VKKYGWKNKLVKILALAALVSVVLFLIPAHQAHAAFFDIAGSLVAKAAYYVNYFFAFIWGVFIAVEIFITQIMLQINNNVPQTSLVQTGFSVVLAIANLGFVLGIIIVALATILRRETYGVKSLLWKIVIMAIFVNFALVVATPIINFSSSLTNYFLGSFQGSGQNGNFTAFEQGIAGAFQPQDFITPENATMHADISAMTYGCVAGDQPDSIIACSQSGTDKTCADAQGCSGRACKQVPAMDCGSPANAKPSQQLSNLTATSSSGVAVGGFIGTFLGAGVSVIVAQICLLLIVIVLAVFNLMLLIRYVYLVMLLIVAPFAWMSWVFPSMKKYFSQWWSNFIRWTFFPPIVIFFMWLVLTMGKNIAPGGSTLSAISASNGVGNFFSGFISGVLSNLIASGVNAFVMIALMLGGMYAANKLSITGAGAALGAAKGIGNSIQGFAAKRGLKMGRAAARAAGGKLAEKVRTGRLGQGKLSQKLEGIPHVGGLFRPVTGLGRAIQTGAASAARGAQGRMYNADMVEAEAKNVPKNPVVLKKDLASGNLNKEKTFAYLAKGIKDGTLKKKDKVGNQTVEEFFKTRSGDIEAYDQGALEYDYRIRTGRKKNIEAAEKAIKAAGPGADPSKVMVNAAENIKDEFGRVIYAAKQEVNASDLLAASYRDMATGYTKAQAEKLDTNDMSEDELKKIIGAFAVYSPALIAPLLKNSKGPALTKIQSVYKDAIKEKADSAPAELDAEIKAISGNKELSAEDAKESVQQFEMLKNAIPTRVNGVPKKKNNGDIVMKNGKPVMTGGAEDIIERTIMGRIIYAGDGSEAGGGEASGTPKP